jgi:hypothetical protein
MSDRFFDEYWQVYKQAMANAVLDPDWDLTETRRLYALDQANLSDELEETLLNAIDHQSSILIFEIYQLMVAQKV